MAAVRHGPAVARGSLRLEAMAAQSISKALDWLQAPAGVEISAADVPAGRSSAPICAPISAPTSTAVHLFRPGRTELDDPGPTGDLLDRVASLRSRTTAPARPVTGTRLRIRGTSAGQITVAEIRALSFGDDLILSEGYPVLQPERSADDLRLPPPPRSAREGRPVSAIRSIEELLAKAERTGSAPRGSREALDAEARMLAVMEGILRLQREILEQVMLAERG